ncbi:MFS transporter small subunit [Paludisphaera mucosa]
MKSSPFRLALAWGLVLIPLGWGVFQSLTKSLPLFQR